jgi:hypothetical protein
MNRSGTRTAATLAELLAGLAAGVVLLAMLVPVMAQTKRDSGVDGSISNLRTLWNAHQTYAADWNGRQMTLVVDELAEAGGVQGLLYEHPGIELGWGCSDQGLWGYYFNNLPVNAGIVWPINPFGSNFGWFRMPNAKALHDYVKGKFYEPTYYAPNDTAVMNVVASTFDVPCEFFIVPGQSGTAPPFWSSYCLSASALFNPAVMARDNPTSPMGLVGGFTVPSFAQAKYPHLKTHIIEHNWVQNPPAVCNPAFPTSGKFLGCEPYYFNHGLVSAPACVFFDGSVRLVPNTEVLAADAAIAKDLGSFEGLWFRPGGAMVNFGFFTVDGYFNSSGIDDIEVNHTILTIDGILGRDTLEGFR